MEYTYVADFETTSESQAEKDGYTSVWAVACMNVLTEEKTLLSNSLAEFMNWCSKDNTRHKTKTIYFHNLKFDGAFIVDFLLRKGFRHSTERKLYAGEFSTLISDTGVWYEIKVCYRHYGTRGVFTYFRDSLKKLPFSVGRIGKAFDVGAVKGEIDYNKYRKLPHTITTEEEEYIWNDVRIIARALKIQIRQGLDKMTIGSDAMSSFKSIIGKDKYNYLFPELDVTIDRDLRQSYKGGWVYLNPTYRDVVLYNVVQLDVNSLYPYSMHSPHLLPYGDPIYYEGEYVKDETYPLYIQYIMVSMTIKKDHLPTIQLKNNWRFSSTEYILDTGDEPIELALTSVDLQLLYDHYDIHYIEYLEGFKFMGVSGIFDEYIEYWGHIKETSEGALRELAKLMLNNLYGKYGTNPTKRNMIPYYDKKEQIVKYKKSEEFEDRTQYVAMASFITAYARNTTIRTAQSFYPHFVYSDTDSLKLVGITIEEVRERLEIHSTKLGAWDYEGTAFKFKALRPKTYVIEDEYKAVDITCAGLPNKARKGINFNDFTFGLKVDGKLQQRKVKGGVILRNTTFEIKPIRENAWQIEEKML